MFKWDFFLSGVMSERFSFLSGVMAVYPGAGSSVSPGDKPNHALPRRVVVGSILHGVNPLSYFSFQPVLHD